MTNWFETLEGIHAQVWNRLSQAATDRAALALATVSPDNWPEVRTVVLRDTNTTAKMLEVYTDSQSDKITSLLATPRAAFLLWDADLALQIRVHCNVSILMGDDIMDRWQAIPDHSKLNYGITPPPGQIIPDAHAYAKEPDLAVFAVLSCEVLHFDAVHLGDTHCRASFSRLSDWQGNWLAP